MNQICQRDTKNTEKVKIVQTRHFGGKGYTNHQGERENSEPPMPQEKGADEQICPRKSEPLKEKNMRSMREKE